MHWNYGAEAQDYDMTASLVKELDLIISVPTAVVDLAGALGVETWMTCPKNPMWKYGTKGDNYPWYKSVKLYRQIEEGDWDPVIAKLSAHLQIELATRERALELLNSTPKIELARA